MTTVAKVKMCDTLIGAVSWNPDRGIGYFEYDKEFIRSGIEPAPLTMPLSEQIYSFPTLNKITFHGLPGLLSDSIPDKFGNALIDAWLAKQGRTPESFNPVERLCYIGTRGMGALEYFPPSDQPGKSKEIDINALAELASDILTKRKNLNANLDGKEEEAIKDILRIGTSAGGARAKAIIAWNPTTNEVRSGQVKADKDFSYWILKFDGVENNKDKELADPKGFGLIEYAYYKMALEAGIQMSECRILKENNRNHFVTRRFDRTDEGDKIHMLSLGAMAHYDYNTPGAYSYEQAMRIVRTLDMPVESVEEQFLRMTFNIIARNQDDHVKNIAFLMNEAGQWSLSPAFDMMYSYNPSGSWTGSHQMTLNSKRDNFSLEDFEICAENVSLKKTRATEILNQVQNAVSKWPECAAACGVPEEDINKISNAHRKIL